MTTQSFDYSEPMIPSDSEVELARHSSRVLGEIKRKLSIDIGFGDIVESIQYSIPLLKGTKGALFESNVKLSCYPKEFDDCLSWFSNLELILQKTSELQNKKTGNIVISENISGGVPSTGAFSNPVLEGMKKLYELQSFLDVRLLRPGEDSSRVREELLALTGT